MWMGTPSEMMTANKTSATKLDAKHSSAKEFPLSAEFITGVSLRYFAFSAQKKWRNKVRRWGCDCLSWLGALEGAMVVDLG